MIPTNTILLGIDKDGSKIYSSDYHHILLVAPHGSGKGVSFVIPNLLTFHESAIIHDIKLDNYTLTSGYRASIGHKIFVWNPLNTDETTHKYNPLDFINLNDTQIVNDVQKLVNILINTNGKYDIEARNLLTALILFLCADTSKPRTFGEIARMLNGNLIQNLSSSIDKVKHKFHHFGYDSIKTFLNKDPKAQNKVIRALNKYLEPWHNPLIDHATSKSDFDIADFKKHKMTLYVGLHPTDIHRLQPLMQFFYQHTAERLMTSHNTWEEGKGVCIFLDEYYSIGKMGLLVSYMPYLRGSRIKLFLITSNLEHLEEVYGESDTINMLSICAVKIAFTPYHYKTADKISQLCIDKEHDAELLSCAKIMNLPEDNQILLRNNMQPLITKKFVYHTDAEMKKKIMDPS